MTMPEEEYTSPWQILELAEEVRDKKEIKRAYARAIKVYRPDTHPEEFRIRRDAYEQLLGVLEFEERIARYQAEAGNDDDDEAEENEGVGLDNAAEPKPAHEGVPEENNRAESIPDDEGEVPFTDAGAQAAAAIIVSPSTKLDEVPVVEKSLDPEIAIPAANKALLAGELTVERWQVLVQFEAGQDAATLARLIEDAVLFKELDNDRNEVTLIIINYQIDQSNFEFLENFSKEWLSNIDRTCFIRAGLFSMYLCGELAIVKFVVAGLLFNKAHDYLSPQDRNHWAVYNAERLLRASGELRYYPDRIKIYVARIIRSGEWDGDTNSALNKDLIERIACLYADSETRNILQERVPELIELSDEYARSHKRPEDRREKTVQRTRRTAKAKAPEKSFSCMGFLILFLVFGQISRCVSNMRTSSSGSSSSYTPHYNERLRNSAFPNQTDAQREQIEKFLREAKEKNELNKNQNDRFKKQLPQNGVHPNAPLVPKNAEQILKDLRPATPQR